MLLGSDHSMPWWIDDAYYYAHNPDVASSGMEAAEHYATYGGTEGRSPSALFDARYYLAENPDVAAAGLNPLEHYLTFGWHEGRNPNPLFSTTDYLAANPDVAASGMNPLEHYATFGWHEGRDPSSGFDTEFYLAENPDVLASGMNPLSHYLAYGHDEGRRPVPPTFTAAVADGTVHFSGTAVGDVAMASIGDTATFTREGIQTAVAHFAGVDAIALDGLRLTADASALSAKAVTGGGTLHLTGVRGDTDLSRVDGQTGVTVEVDHDLDLSANSDLGAVDTFNVADGAILTLSAMQAEAAAVDGDYAIRDTAARLFADATVRPSVAGPPGGVTVAGAVDIADLNALSHAVQGALTYASVVDAADRLVSGGGTSAFILHGTDVEVVGTATVAQLAAIDDANGAGRLVYGAVHDTVEHLVSGGEANAFVVPGTDVEVAGSATLSELAAIDAANGSGALGYASVADTAADLAANSGGYVKAGTDVRVAGAATIAQLAAIDAANGGGGLAYAHLNDALEHLFVDGAASPYIVPGTDVAATGTATVAQLAVLDAANGGGALTCTALLDTWQSVLSDAAQGFLAGVADVRLADYDLGEATVAEVRALLGLSNLHDGDGGAIDLGGLAFRLADSAADLAASTPMAAEIIAHAGAVEATDAATVLQAEIIHDRSAAAVYDVVDDPYSIAHGDADAVTAAFDLTAEGEATAEEAVAVLNRDGPAGGVAFNIRDTFFHVDGIAPGAREAATDIHITTQSDGWPPYLTVAQAATVLDYGNTGRTTIDHIGGTAADINGFVEAHQETGGSQGVGYGFWVQDSPASILAAIGDGSPGRIAFITGNPEAGLEGDHRAAGIEAQGSFDVAGAEAFWSAAQPVFGDAAATAGRTYYGVEGTVAAYDNQSADGDPVGNADYLRLSDTAANVHAAQNGLDAAHSHIFGLLDARQNYADGIYVTGSPGYQWIRGTAGYDVIDGGADNDWIRAGSGGDVVFGGTGADQLYGEDGKDVLYAGDAAADTVYSDARYRGWNAVSGGAGGDDMFGSVDIDVFRYEGGTRAALRAESGTAQDARDYITNFALGDRIEFSGVDDSGVQFFGSGSANAQNVDPGVLGLSVRYEKNVQVLNSGGDGLVAATRVLVDVADGTGHFDDVADMQIILVGSNIDVNWDGHYLLFGG